MTRESRGNWKPSSALLTSEFVEGYRVHLLTHISTQTFLLLFDSPSDLCRRFHEMDSV